MDEIIMRDYSIADVKEGLRESFVVTITEKMMHDWLMLTGDRNPLHCDSSYAKAKGFDGCVVYGLLSASFLSTLAGMYLPGRKSLIQALDIKYVKPVFVNDELEVIGEVTEVYEELQMIRLKVIIQKCSGERVVKGKMQVGFLE